MPIYEYRCEACQHELEALQKISDEPLVVCPKCNAPALRKQVSAAGFRLKGGGWYETDFKSGGKKNIVSDKEGASTSGAVQSDAAKPSGDAAPAATSSTKPSTT